MHLIPTPATDRRQSKHSFLNLNGELGTVTKPVCPCKFINVVPVPISQEIIGLPHAAASKSDIPKLSDLSLDGKTNAKQRLKSATLSVSEMLQNERCVNFFLLLAF